MRLKRIFETIQDKNRLVQALKDGNLEAAKKAISDMMKHKRREFTPAQELGIEDSEYRQLTHNLKGGSVKGAAKVLGIGGEYTQRGIGAETVGAGSLDAVDVKLLIDELEDVLEQAEDEDYRNAFYGSASRDFPENDVKELINKLRKSSGGIGIDYSAGQTSEKDLDEDDISTLEDVIGFSDYVSNDPMNKKWGKMFKKFYKQTGGDYFEKIYKVFKGFGHVS